MVILRLLARGIINQLLGPQGIRPQGIQSQRTQSSGQVSGTNTRPVNSAFTVRHKTTSTVAIKAP